MSSETFRVDVTESHVVNQMGNAIRVNVFDRLLAQATRCTTSVRFIRIGFGRR